MLTILNIKTRDFINKSKVIIKAKVNPKSNLTKIRLNAAKKSIIPKNLAIIDLKLKENLKCFW